MKYYQIKFCIFFIVTSLFRFTLAASGNNEKGIQTGIPANLPSVITFNQGNKTFTVSYQGKQLLQAHYKFKTTVISSVKKERALEQFIQITSAAPQTIEVTVFGGEEALAAETNGKAQKQFPLVRTSFGLSNNLRNNAIYDRTHDWMLEMPEGTAIQARKKYDGTTLFTFSLSGKQSRIIFRPLYYQKYKNLACYEPWNYTIKKESLTGWSSWWAYERNIDQPKLQKLLDVWQQKHFVDYGYRFIQFDDGYQGGNDAGRKLCPKANAYNGGRPTTWLDWQKTKFPLGLTEYVASIREKACIPGIWMGCFFSDEETVFNHPEWFVSDNKGVPYHAPWVGHAMDASSDEVAESLIRPTFRGFKNAGIDYLKIDQLRHFLYDCANNNPEWFEKHHLTPSALLRAYLRIAREEMGNNTFILACWGVLPEAIGLVDACRLGGDGYGPVTMQQYNSWNGIVWRNDPDLCDILPQKTGAGTGNITKFVSTKSTRDETIIRPALASIAGAMLMISDKPEVYENDSLLTGVRRSSPVLFTVPGQLYDYESQKTDLIKKGETGIIKNGAHPTPFDADQFGLVCPYWLNEFNTGFDKWVVLHRLNWTKGKQVTLPQTTVHFSDLGLDSTKEYLVYEFWSNKMIGVVRNKFESSALAPNGIESYAIREKQNHPQLVSTNRHLSQGAAEIEMMLRDTNSITGRSKVIVDDEYVMTFYIPSGYRFKNATVNDSIAQTEFSNSILKVKYLPRQTASIRWQINYEKI